MQEDIAKFRDLFLGNKTVQNRIKATATNDDAIKESVTIGQENGLVFTEQQMRDAIRVYAFTGESPSDLCDLPVNAAPFFPPTVDSVLNSIRQVDSDYCSW